MKILLLSAALLVSALALFSCNKDNPIPPEDQPQINLTLEDTSCTEAWIKLSTVNLNLPAEVSLQQDDSLIQNVILNSSDTLLYVDSLLPNHTYKFQSGIQSSNRSSNSLEVTTMDTTSHNFTFETFTFGGTAGSCALYYVAIIDENDIWAVGEIYLADSSQNGYTMYNAVHWNGSQWELKRIRTNACGGVVYPPIKAIFAFSADDILFAHTDGSITHFNGIAFTNDCSLITELNGSANKIWGTSKDDYYVVSGNGFIAHYQNGQWSRIESGTDLNINDIWGAYNEKTDQYEILAVASGYPSNIEKAILLIRNDMAEQVTTTPILWPLFTIWFIPNRIYYSAGSGIYQKHLIQDSAWKNKILDITTFTSTSIRGNNINDVFVVGAFGDFDHFNGVSWKNDYIEPLLDNGAYTSVSTKGDMVVAVGSNQISINSEAVILIGRR